MLNNCPQQSRGFLIIHSFHSNNQIKSKYLNKTNHIKGNNLEEVSLKEFLVHLQEQLQRPTNQFIFDQLLWIHNEDFHQLPWLKQHFHNDNNSLEQTIQLPIHCWTSICILPLLVDENDILDSNCYQQRTISYSIHSFSLCLQYHLQRYIHNHVNLLSNH